MFGHFGCFNGIYLRSRPNIVDLECICRHDSLVFMTLEVLQVDTERNKLDLLARIATFELNSLYFTVFSLVV